MISDIFIELNVIAVHFTISFKYFAKLFLSVL